MHGGGEPGRPDHHQSCHDCDPSARSRSRSHAPPCDATAVPQRTPVGSVSGEDSGGELEGSVVAPLDQSVSGEDSGGELEGSVVAPLDQD